MSQFPLFHFRRCGLATACYAVVGIIAVATAAEESSSALLIEAIAESRVQAANGSDYVPAERLHVGDEIFYTLRVRNITDSAVQDAVVIKSMPRNTRYVTDSATGPAASVTFSIDGGRTFASQEQLVVSVPDGTTRPATVDDYTHIRWRLRHPLAAGATALLRFRGVFN